MEKIIRWPLRPPRSYARFLHQYKLELPPAVPTIDAGVTAPPDDADAALTDQVPTNTTTHERNIPTAIWGDK